MAEYIEREAALEIVSKQFQYAWEIPCGYDEKIVQRRATAAKEEIRALPAVDVAEVRRGHWIDCEDDYSSYVRCSVCGNEYTNWEADCAHTDFCPNCGARMDASGNMGVPAPGG